MIIRILLLTGFILEIIFETGFGFDRVIFTGFSLKNVMLLILLLGIINRPWQESRRRIKYTRHIHRNYILFLIVITVSSLLVPVFTEAKGYEIAKTLILIKTTGFDPYLVFCVFLLYPRDIDEFSSILKTGILVISFAAGLTVLGSLISPGMFFGLDDDASRINGPFGEPNQTAAVLAMLLVPVLGRLICSKRISYMALVAAGSLLICMVLTGSRGGLLAVTISFPIFLFSIRRYIGVGRKMLLVLSLPIFIIAIWLVIPEPYKDMVLNRLAVFHDSHIDFAHASSGRTQLWSLAIAKWQESPLIGYGWLRFSEIFQSPTHNTYLEILFSAGPLALLFYLLTIKNLISHFKHTASMMTANERWVAIAFVYGVVALAIAIFFVNLYVPWLVVWAFIGIMAGYCCNYFSDKKAHEASNRLKNIAVTELEPTAPC